MTEPARSISNPAELLNAYLDQYRDTVLRKLDGLSDEELRRSRLPSGWSPLSMLKHLAYVELRWLRWGFAAETIAEPRADRVDETGDFLLGPDETFEEIRTFFFEQCARSRAIVALANLEDVAAVGGQFGPSDDRPTLAWTLFHVLQEYARHAGHLDIARELADNTTGE